jgi:hypothetical protein
MLDTKEVKNNGTFRILCPPPFLLFTPPQTLINQAPTKSEFLKIGVLNRSPPL